MNPAEELVRIDSVGTVAVKRDANWCDSRRCDARWRPDSVREARGRRGETAQEDREERDGSFVGCVHGSNDQENGSERASEEMAAIVRDKFLPYSRP